MITSKLGNIKQAYFGLGGPNNSLIGLHLVLGNDSWEASVFNNCFFDMYKSPLRDTSSFSEEQRDDKYATIVKNVSDILATYKVNCVSELEGLPVVAKFHNNVVKHWEPAKL